MGFGTENAAPNVGPPASAAPGAGAAFGGAKIAVIADGAVLTLLRDDIATIPHPGKWDLPGGAREGMEAPLDCALRELDEEFGLRLDPARVAWRRFYPTRHGAWFFGAYWPGLDPARVRFGDEGQRWALMPVADYLARGDAIPALQSRLNAFLLRA